MGDTVTGDAVVGDAVVVNLVVLVVVVVSTSAGVDPASAGVDTIPPVVGAGAVLTSTVVTAPPAVEVGGSGDSIGTVDTMASVDIIVGDTVVGDTVTGDRVNSARELSTFLRWKAKLADIPS